MSDIYLEVRDITKKFPGVIANDHINVVFDAGEVHAIIGENGAGKSTFCNILTGIYPPDEGQIITDGQEKCFENPDDALRSGIAMVYQERNLVSDFTGAQNILLGKEPVKSGFGIIDEKETVEKAEEVMKGFDIDIDIPLNIPAAYLSTGQQQMVEIIRALRFKSRVLILDEPTSSLGRAEIDSLFKVVERVTARGTTVIFISHKLDEVFSISDTISVFRNGKCVDTRPVSEITRNECVNLMVNRDLGRIYPEYENMVREQEVLRLKDVGDTSGFLKDVNFNLKKGEIVGWYGLVGSGRTEFAETVSGIREVQQGIVSLKDRGVQGCSTEELMKQGLFMIPEDRRRNALFPYFNIQRNVSITYLDKLVDFLVLILPGKERKLTRKYLDSEELSIKYGKLDDDIESLSGGNKQKIVITRAIKQDKLSVLVADEPTQGIDVGAKFEIYGLFRLLARKGVGIIFISSELPELMGICDKICVFHNGEIVAEVKRKDFARESIMAYALGIK